MKQLKKFVLLSSFRQFRAPTAMNRFYCYFFNTYAILLQQLSSPKEFTSGFTYPRTKTGEDLGGGGWRPSFTALNQETGARV